MLAGLSQAASPSLTYMVPTRILLIYLILFIYFLKWFSLIMWICRGRPCACDHRMLQIPGVPGGCEPHEVGAGNWLSPPEEQYVCTLNWRHLPSPCLFTLLQGLAGPKLMILFQSAGVTGVGHQAQVRLLFWSQLSSVLNFPCHLI